MKRFVYTLLLLFAALMINAQELLNPPTEGLYGGINQDDNGVVGAIGGTVDVSALGGATYTIPVQVPEGIGGIQPNLSIVYNSQSGNGLLGWGWNLGGVSAIARVGKTQYHDGEVKGVNFKYDRYALDGQRLILVNGEFYGANNSEYKTEVDGLSKIVAHNEKGIVNGPGWFTVYTADGLFMEYGKEGARMAFDAEEQGKKEVGIWLLRRVTDRNGNYMEYHYVIEADNYRLNDIQYTKNDNGGLNAFYGVDFHYYGETEEDNGRVDVEMSFLGNHKILQPWLLKDISVYHWSEPLYKYEFEYDATGGVLNSRFYYYRLNEIRLVYENGFKYNSTVVQWDDFPNVNNGNFNFHDGYVSYIEPENLNQYSGLQKFPGDFNGDGLSDFISIYNDSKKEITYAQVFINKGNTKSTQSPGKVWFEKRGRLLSFENYQLCWIYVCDFDGDGMDDFYFMSESKNNILYKQVHIYACKSYLDDEGNWSYRMIKFYNGMDCDYYSVNVGKKQHVTLLTGDFVGREKTDAIFQIPTFINPEPFGYFEYRNGKIMVNWADDYNNNGQLIGDNYVCGDFDGDGMTEIWMSGIAYKIQKTGQWFYQYECVRDMNKPGGGVAYAGDFNGDGCTDFLSFNENAGAEQRWKIYITHKTNTESPITYNITPLIELYTGGLAPYYGHSLESHSKMQYYIDIADMNGDGKSDIVIINGANNMHILYAPIFESATKDGRAYGQFAFHEEILDAGNTGIGNNFTNSNICARCAGNFLGQENQGIIDATVFSLPQLSTYYNVKTITDGMGNTTSIEYDYLIDNPKKQNDKIYTLSDIGKDIGNGKCIYHTPLPIRAVKRVENHNAFDKEHHNEFSTSTRYSYTNALIHKYGRGFLGFAETEVAIEVSGVCQSIVKNESSVEPMGYNCMAVPVKTELFDGNKNRKSESEMLYYKARSITDTIVFAPLLTWKLTTDYETGKPQNALRTTLEVSNFQTDRDERTDVNSGNDFIPSREATELFYDKVFCCPSNFTMIGKGKLNILDFLLFGASEFTNSSTTTFVPNDYANWVINLPATIKTTASRKGDDYDDISSLKAYEYSYSRNPFLPTKVSVYPNGEQDDNDEFGTYTKYGYDNIFGHVVNTTFQDTRRQLHPKKTEYVYNRIEGNYTNPGRFLLKEITYPYDQPQYETNYDYDEVLGMLLRTTDCRGNYVKQTPDPMGVRSCSRKMYRGDVGGVESCSEMLWVYYYEENQTKKEEDAPDNALYYNWAQEGSLENGEVATLPVVKTYYDGGGRVLRTVTTDVMGNVVYSDTEYDCFGNVSFVYDPYFKGDSRGNNTAYSYDVYQRIDKITYPDQTVRNTIFEDGFTTTTEYQGQKTKTEVNIVGWTEKNSDFINDGNNGATEIPVSYDYYSDGSLWTASAEGGGTITLTYDAAGNRHTLSDPDYGLTTTTYNAYGELKEQTTPKGCTTSYAYDGMGRMKSRAEIDQNNVAYSTEWHYSPHDWNLGLLEQIDYNKGQQVINYSYNSRLLPVIVEESRSFGSENYATKYEYDGFGHTNYVTYPTGYRIQKLYENGHLKEIKDGNGNSLWNTTKVNALGQIEKFVYGNGIESEYSYEHPMHYLMSQTAKKNDEIIQNFVYGYDNFSNLRHRTDNKHGMKEVFGYDDLNRLVYTNLNDDVYSEMEYDDCGRILSKDIDGEWRFALADYSGDKPHAIKQAVYNEDAPFSFTGSHNVTYTMFDKVKEIHAGPQHVSFEYGYDHQRISMSQSNYKNTVTSKRYIGNCEIEGVSIRTYISGPMGVFAVYELSDFKSGDDGKNGGYEGLHYIHKDHLGSWTTITDEEGNIEQELSFDAWGNFRNPYTWTGANTTRPMFDRGFTGHEHLYDFGLINMNGRMYDPIMSSFLSVDNYVQSPENSQNFNRYAYCLNNPLKYTDPDGEFWHLVIGAAIGGTINLLTNWMCGNVDNFGQGLAYFGIGALAGGLSAGVGGGMGVAYCGESFAAGFLGTTVAAAPSALGFAGGLCVGGSAGLTTGFILGSGNKWMQGESFSDGLLYGLNSGICHGVIGGVSYGIVGAIGAGLKGNNWYDGSKDYDINLVNRNMPKVQQVSEKNCIAAVGESTSAKDGTGFSQSQIRTLTGKGEDESLFDYDTMEAYRKAVGGGKYAKIAGEMPENRPFVKPETSVDHMLNPDTHTWINLDMDKGHEVVLNRVYKSVHISPRGRLSIDGAWRYEVMDPWLGNYHDVTLKQIQGSSNILYLKLIK